jgi:hypothetical protein
MQTKITVRVIAKDGKFLGDDIGGALVTVRDAQTRELLAQGVTVGGSGPNDCGGVMCVALRRGQPIPYEDASEFSVTLDLTAPRRIEVSAFGPLAARQSANTVSATQWVYPGKDIVAGDGFLLEIPGLIVQIIHPPTHFTPALLRELRIRANVAMMCGCPIEPKSGKTRNCCELPDDEQPWLPEEFEVQATIQSGGKTIAEVPLAFVPIPRAPTPGQFEGVWMPPEAGGIFQITVYAYQKANGNTGVDVATVVVPKAAA